MKKNLLPLATLFCAASRWPKHEVRAWRGKRKKGETQMNANSAFVKNRLFSFTTMDTIGCTMDTIIVPIVKTIVSIVVKKQPVPFTFV